MGVSGITVGEGLRVDGVLVHTVAPLRTLWIPLDNGLTVLYGRNGAGKSKVLNAIASAFRGEAIAHGHVALHLSVNEYFSGWDDRLLLKIAETLRGQVALHAMFGEVEDVSPFSPPESDVRSDEYEAEVLEIGSEVRADLRTLADRFGASDGHCHSPRLALVASGTAEWPMWKPFVSVVPTDLAAFADRYSPIPDLVWASLVALGPSNEGYTMPHSLVGLRAEDGWVDRGLPVIVSSVAAPEQFDGERLVEGIPARDTIACLRAEDETDWNRATLDTLRSEIETTNLIAYADEKTFEPLPEARTWFNDVAAAATLLLRSLTGDDAASLQVQLRHPGTWLDALPIEWRGSDPYGTVLPVEELGAGARRWAQLAISLALHNLDFTQPAVIIVDEPERALHSAAQQRAAAAFAKTMDSYEIGAVPISALVVATHAPAFLSLPDAELVHVSRNGTVDIQLDRVDTTIGVEGLTAQLGLVRSDALLTVRWFLYVEGEHDVAVLNALYSDHFARRHVIVQPMYGASKVAAHINAQHLLAYSDARFRVILDNIGSAAGAAWNEARAAAADGDPDAARRGLEKISRMRGTEAEWLYEAGVAALSRNSIDRIEVVGLDEPDIINYLPVQSIVQSATSWDELAAEWRQNRKEGFKDWLRQAKGASFNARQLGEIAALIDDRRDLDKVINGL